MVVKGEKVRKVCKEVPVSRKIMVKVQVPVKRKVTRLVCVPVVKTIEVETTDVKEVCEYSGKMITYYVLNLVGILVIS